jgi:hypothetical protein
MPAYRHGWSRGWKKSSRGEAREWYDSSWELQYMLELERDPLVGRWTRHHGLRIPYRKWWGGSGHYEPDFLVELVDGCKELREVKGEHLFSDGNTTRKLRAGEAFCRQRGMTFRVVTKSKVDPAAWALEEPTISVAEASRHERPAFADDAHAAKPRGCLTALARLMLAALAAACGLAWVWRWR